MQCAVRIAVAAWFAVGTAPAPAATPPDEIGVLTCTVGPIVNAYASGTSVGNEAREMLCSFKTGQGPEETYAALNVNRRPDRGGPGNTMVGPGSARYALQPGAAETDLCGGQSDAGGTGSPAYRRAKRYDLSVHPDTEATGRRLEGRATSPSANCCGHGIGPQGCGRLVDCVAPRKGSNCQACGGR